MKQCQTSTTKTLNLSLRRLVDTRRCEFASQHTMQRLRRASRAVLHVLKRDMELQQAPVSPTEFFSDQEVDRLRLAFDMHVRQDMDDSSLLSGDLRHVLKTLFIVPTKSELAILTSKMDVDGSGRIDFPSFFEAIAAFTKPQYGRAKLDKAFYEISGGLDRIDSASLQRLMLRLGQSTIRMDDCEAMIREVDREGGGYISLDDFHHMQTRSFDD